MTTPEELAAQMAHLSGKMTAGSTNAQMKEWYMEYKRLERQFKASRVNRTSKLADTSEAAPLKKM